MSNRTAVAGPNSQADGLALYRLLGLPASVSIQRLRHTYEWAIADASRRGDHERLLALSSAFDHLEDKHAIYASAGPRTATPMVSTSSPAFAYVSASAPRELTSSRAARLRRVVMYGVVVPALVIGFVFVAIRWGVGGSASPAQVRPADHVGNSAAPSTSTSTAKHVIHASGSAGSKAKPGWIVPVDAPTGHNGLVSVSCLDNNAYVQSVPRGAEVMCGGGATPHVVN